MQEKFNVKFYSTCRIAKKTLAMDFLSIKVFSHILGFGLGFFVHWTGVVPFRTRSGQNRDFTPNLDDCRCPLTQPNYSNSTNANQFCLEIIFCRVLSLFDYLIYPYYPSYMS